LFCTHFNVCQLSHVVDWSTLECLERIFFQALRQTSLFSRLVTTDSMSMYNMPFLKLLMSWFLESCGLEINEISESKL